MEGASLVALAGVKGVFAKYIVKEGANIEELNYTKEFGEINGVVAILVSGVVGKNFPLTFTGL